MAKKKSEFRKAVEKANKEQAEHAEDAVEHGYSYNALDPDLQAALDREKDFLEDAKALQESDDPEDLAVKRSQV